MESLDKAMLCLGIIKERKAVDPVVFDMGKLTTIADYFLITSGKSSRQVQAISRHLGTEMRKRGFRPYGVEGEEKGHWILMDYGDIVVHVFYHPVREFYDLEGFWIEADRIAAE
jgi:ribosome-associated protein